MQKNKIIILAIIVVIIFVGSFVWFLSQKGAVPSGGETPGEEEEEEEEELEETFSLSAKVSSVDVANNFLVVKPTEQETEIKVIISETTKLVKLEFPFDPKNPPKEASFTPIKTEIELSGFKTGDNVFIKSRDNIAGQTEISNIDFIHILP